MKRNEDFLTRLEKDQVARADKTIELYNLIKNYFKNLIKN